MIATRKSQRQRTHVKIIMVRRRIKANCHNHICAAPKQQHANNLVRFSNEEKAVIN